MNQATALPALFRIARDVRGRLHYAEPGKALPGPVVATVRCLEGSRLEGTRVFIPGQEAGFKAQGLERAARDGWFGLGWLAGDQLPAPHQAQAPPPTPPPRRSGPDAAPPVTEEIQPNHLRALQHCPSGDPYFKEAARKANARTLRAALEVIDDTRPGQKTRIAQINRWLQAREGGA